MALVAGQQKLSEKASNKKLTIPFRLFIVCDRAHFIFSGVMRYKNSHKQ
jgi:hypothetical protein